MIVTVTMNPAIDKTVEVEKLVCRGLNRIRKVEYDAGGKGINVSKTIRELGGYSIATGFLGGNNGQIIADVLRKKGITCDFVCVSGETRTNTKVVEDDGSLTELKEAGALIQDEDIDPPPKLVHGNAMNKYVWGLGKVGEAVKLLIDPDRLIKDEDLEFMEEAAEEAQAEEDAES